MCFYPKNIKIARAPNIIKPISAKTQKPKITKPLKTPKVMRTPTREKARKDNKCSQQKNRLLKHFCSRQKKLILCEKVKHLFSSSWTFLKLFCSSGVVEMERA